MSSRSLALALLAGCALACFAPDFRDGLTPCGPGGECPGALQCAVDRRCYRAGVAPPECLAGYQRATDGQCVDVNECEKQTAGCDVNATCTNSPGSYSCACRAGFTGPGTTCTDVNECTSGAATCDAHATCTNTPGTYTCACKPGWIGDGRTCAQSFTQIATSGDHSCALRGDGALYCWGANDLGQLGTGKGSPDSRVPVRIGAAAWSAIAVGDRTTCGIRQDGTLWCWGDDACALVGDGGENLFCDGATPIYDPFPTGGAARWKALAIGSSHACAIQTDGSLWCWGENLAGELGTSDDAPRTTPARVGQDLASDKDWSAITAGRLHTCGLRGGRLWCFGDNTSGQLGDGKAEPKIGFPKPVGTGAGWLGVAAGDLHTCAVASDQTLSCFGAGAEGQLGNGKTGAAAASDVPAVVPGTIQWVAVAAGAQATCGRTTTGGLFCFGDNRFGQLGDGTFTDRPAPTAVSRTPDFATVALGRGATCATRTTGQMWCWGRNDSGAIGVGTGGPVPTPTDVPGAGTFTMLAAGASHQCGLRPDKSLWCWGANGDGQLGVGVAGGFRDAPTQVAGGGAWSWVAAGEHSTCAVQSGGGLRCWGGNRSGELGLGSHGADAGTATPQAVSGGGSFTRVSVRQDHACGLQTDGSLWCWGSTFSGRLGIGDPGTRTTVDAPTRLLGSGWNAVAAGESHTCGVRGGALYCWGANAFGQLGLGPPTSASGPVLAPAAVGTDTDWTAISTGRYHTCGLRSPQGTLLCWGYNFYGQVGNGSSGANANALAPSVVSPGKAWQAVAAGAYTTCAVAQDGNLSCFGSNAGGLVGKDGAGEVVPLPVQLDDSRTFIQVGLLAAAGCALHASGQMACWGQSPSGEIGDDTAFYESPVAVKEP